MLKSSAYFAIDISFRASFPDASLILCNYSQRQTDEPLMKKMMMNSSTTDSPPDERTLDGVIWQNTVTWMGDELEEGCESR